MRDILIVCCDGLTGLPEAIEATFKQTTLHTCTVHLIRASMRFVSYKDRGKPAGKRTAPGRLVEGHQTQGWTTALQALTIAYPDRITPHLH